MKRNATLFGNLVTMLFMALLGFLFLVPATYKLYNYCRFRTHSVAVYGIIDKASRGRDWGARPLVQYEDFQGNVYEIKSKAKTHWFIAPKKGERIKVLFLAQNPENAIVDSLFHYIVFPVLLMAVGAATVGYAIRNGWREFQRTSECPKGMQPPENMS
jgi:hypothetical protein